MKFKREEGNDKPIYSRLGSLSNADFVFCSLNSIIGTGALRLGSAFNSGILFTHIFNIFVALIGFYSIELYVFSAAYFHESTFEEIWSAAFSRSTVLIPAFCSIVAAIANVMSYFSFLQDSVVTIVSMLFKLMYKNPEENLIKIKNFRFLIGILIEIVFGIPICLSNNLRVVVVISYISIIFFLVILVYVVARFFIMISKEGFDPDHRFKTVDLKDHISGSISSLTFSYLCYPFVWPGPRHIKNPSVNNLSKVFAVAIGTSYVLYSIMGTFSYLSFFDANSGDIILEYYPNTTKTDQILLIFGHIVTFVYILFTIPIVMNSSRYILLNALHKKDEFPVDVWGPTGITLSLMSLVLANVTEQVSDYIYIISDLLTLILLFIFPSIFYLKAFKTKKIIHFIGSIFMLILGCVAISFIIYADCFE